MSDPIPKIPENDKEMLDFFDNFEEIELEMQALDDQYYFMEEYDSPEYSDTSFNSYGHNEVVRDGWIRNEVYISREGKQFTLKEVFDDFNTNSTPNVIIQNIKETRTKSQEGFNDFLSNPFLLNLFKDSIIPIGTHSKEVFDKKLNEISGKIEGDWGEERDASEEVLDQIQKFESFIEEGKGLENKKIEQKSVDKCTLSYFMKESSQSSPYPFEKLDSRWVISSKKNFKKIPLKTWDPPKTDFKVVDCLIGAVFEGEFRNKWVPHKTKDNPIEFLGAIWEEKKRLDIIVKFTYEYSLKISVDLNMVKSLMRGARRPSINGDRWVVLTFPYSVPVQFFVLHKNGLSEIWNDQYLLPKNTYRIQVPTSSIRDSKEHFVNTFFINNLALGLELGSDQHLKYFFDEIGSLIHSEGISNEKVTMEMNELHDFLPDEFRKVSSDLGKLSFEIWFGIMSLFTQNKITPDKKLMAEVFKMHKEDEKSLASTLEHLGEFLPGNQPAESKDIVSFIKKHFELSKKKLRLYQKKRKTRVHLSKFRKLILTPSRLIILDKIEECNNAITRAICREKGFESEDALFRVRLLDDNFKGLGYNEEHLMRQLKAKIKKNVVFNHLIEFIGYSGSQLRANCFWAIDKINTMGITVESVKRMIGDLSTEKNIAKHGARRGQPFSSSIPLVRIDEFRDVVRFKDNSCPLNSKLYYTDGIGMIDSKFLDEIGRKAKLNIRFLSAIQVRIGGLKGVLARFPFEEFPDERLRSKKIAVRSSMIKYKSELDELCLLNTNNFLYGFLNRQILILLASLNVPKEGILEIFREYCRMIESFDFGASAPIIDYSDQQWLCPLRKHIPFLLEFYLSTEAQENLNGARDPFLNGLIMSYQAKAYHQLRKKTNILVLKAARLMGVIDEFSVLKEDEVFVCLSEKFDELTGKIILCTDTNREPFVIESTVMVTRNPCLHPGDIRVLKAVDNPKLRELYVNCIVFPQKGEVPVTHMMAGGDLDGDTYFVTWDKRLIPKKTYQWFDYSYVPPRKFETSDPVEVTNDELIDFFVKYNSSDTLGKIDNAHLAISESSEKLALSEDALKCSKLHAEVIDFAKTGYCPNKEDIPKVEVYPTYMEKGKEKMTQRGYSVIQDCFDETIRKITKLGGLNLLKKKQEEAFHAVEAEKNQPILLSFFVLDEWETHEENIVKLISRVSGALLKLKSRFGVKDVFELISGNFTRFQKEETPKDQGYIKSQELVMVTMLNELFSSLRDKYIKALPSEKERKVFVSGLYIVSYCMHFQVKIEDYIKDASVQVKKFSKEKNEALNQKIKRVFGRFSEDFWKRIKENSFSFVVIPWVLGAKELSSLYKETKMMKKN